MKVFIIPKRSCTYSDLLETYGLANILSEITNKIVITDRESYYEIATMEDVTKELILKRSYFQFFKFIKQNADTDIRDVVDYIDYQKQNKIKKEKQDKINEIYSIYNGKKSDRQLKVYLNKIEKYYEEVKCLDSRLDVCAQICSPNNYVGFMKLYENFHENQDIFLELFEEILKYYSTTIYDGREFDKLIKGRTFNKEVTAIQLYNPNQGKGINRGKANGVNAMNFNSSWITETLKISGALSDMICQLVKVGNNYDLKISVPEYKQLNYSFKDVLIPKFKKYLKGNTPIKIDILNILFLTQTILENQENIGRLRKVKDIVVGLRTVYQKDLGQNKAVVNIGFIQVPNFVKFDREKNQIWIDILKEQVQIISNITEQGDATRGLLCYRDFISTSDIPSFFKFSFWYAQYIVSQKSKDKYARLFSIDTLNKFYTSMETQKINFTEIISNKGFLAVAKAIRQSTVFLLYAPKENRKYTIRYGVAQELQNNSRAEHTFVKYIGDFITNYNAETAQKKSKENETISQNENIGIVYGRAIVRVDELDEFYKLLNKYPVSVIGAMLASYGYALNMRNQDKIEENNILEEQ